ncbi:MAG TPA: 50S ribosomal protein L21 [bacterium]|nr:50S ribosomal protein L21 [bacterium]
MYAIVGTGGKQIQVSPGEIVRVETLPGKVGETIEIPEVLLLNRDGNVEAGTPTLPGVRVTAQILSHGRSKKVIVFKHKRRKNYRRRNGHRQGFTEIKITDILAGSGSN